MKALVLGGRGQSGRAITQALHRDGWEGRGHVERRHPRLTQYPMAMFDYESEDRWLATIASR